ncbi:MAG: sodium:proton antiporter [Lachnospiraceae bacterium]|nr:sodium:proton antiporter [Lachnospiraceae bacterium]
MEGLYVLISHGPKFLLPAVGQNLILAVRYGFAGMGLHFDFSGFHALYAVIAVIMWAGAFLFSLEYLKHGNKKLYYISMLITFLSTAGVFLSADLYTLFIFFEIMSLTSYIWVAFDETGEALRASSTYLAVSVTGGLVMLMGIFMLYNLAGTLDITELRTFCSDTLGQALLKREALGTVSASFEGEEGKVYRDLLIAGLCLLFGFGAKAGAFPIHIWLPKAHPVAPAPLSALLSGILTKAGIFGILVMSCCFFTAGQGELLRTDELWGGMVLVIGVFTMLTGALLAVFSINIKRTLACSSVSQIGFILTGAGMYGLLSKHGGPAVSGALMHAVNHSLFKLVLFLSAGAVFMNLHALDLNEIRGFGRNKTVLKSAFLSASLGIMGIPLFSGYISKTLIHEAIVEYYELLKEGEFISFMFGLRAIKLIEWLFLLSGGCTVAYMLKLFICVFVEKNTDEEKQERYDKMAGSYMTPLSKAVILIPAVLCFVFGVFPKATLERFSLMCAGLLNTEELSVSYFSLANLKGGLISIVIGLLIYFFIVRGLLMEEKKEEERKTVYLGDLVIESGEEKLSYMDRLKKKDGAVLLYTDRWPLWLDLEELIYRPLLLRIFPAAFGLVCRFLDSIVDFSVVFLRKTVFKDNEIPHELSEGTGFTYGLGRLFDGIFMILNKTVWRRNPRENVDHVHKFAMKQVELKENEFIILRSMSFGLILFCLGLMVTVVYLMLR